MKKARKASYWRWRGVAGSAKKRRQPVRSNGTLIDIIYNVKHQIWCQSSFAAQTLTITKNPHMTTVFMPNRIFVDNVCFLITNKETSRNCSISAPVRLTSRAKLLSQMNPIAGSMSADSRSVEIQASLDFDQPVPIMAGRVPLGFRLAMNKPVNPIEFDAPSVPLYAPRKIGRAHV